MIHKVAFQDIFVNALGMCGRIAAEMSWQVKWKLATTKSCNEGLIHTAILSVLVDKSTTNSKLIRGNSYPHVCKVAEDMQA